MISSIFSTGRRIWVAQNDHGAYSSNTVHKIADPLPLQFVYYSKWDKEGILRQDVALKQHQRKKRTVGPPTPQQLDRRGFVDPLPCAV